MTVGAVIEPVEVLRAVLRVRVPGTALADVAVRTNERDAGDVPPFVILAQGGDVRIRSGGAYAPARVSLSLTAATDYEAAALWRLASRLLHGWGPVNVDVDVDRVGIWRIFDETGLQRPVKEPDTGWWRAFGVFDITMTDRAIG